MAKKMKYFKHDVDASKDRKIRVLMRKHGREGYAIYFMLLEAIYRNNEPIVDFGNPNVLLGYADDLDLEPEELIDFVQSCVELELFDVESWQDLQVTSQGILRRFDDNKKFYEARAKGAHIANKKIREKKESAGDEA